MGAAERKAKNQSMAADLLRRGYWHGRRATVGVSNVPSVLEQGSAAYRRREPRAVSSIENAYLNSRVSKRLMNLGRRVRRGDIVPGVDWEARNKHGVRASVPKPGHRPTPRMTTGKV